VELLVDGDGPIRTVTMNRPDRMNAVNAGLHRALADVWGRLVADAECKVVVFTGAGPAFSAGGDMDFLDRVANDEEFRYWTMAEARRIVVEMMAFPKPIVAAVNGPAVGLGCSLAVLSDIVLMSDSAFYADPHVSLGVVAADGGALAWPLMMSLLRAKEFLFTGDRISPALAVELGLANRVVPADQLLAEARSLAERLAAQPQRALRDTKRALNLHLIGAVNAVVDFAFASESETFALPEFHAFLDSYKTKVGINSKEHLS
jgi:enoyl-CoA hydratase